MSMASPARPPGHGHSPSGIRAGTRAYRDISLALFLAGFATFSLLYGVQPLMPAFTHDFNVSAAESSLALSLSTGLLALAIFGAGAWSEGRDRRRLISASIGLAALLNIAAACAQDWHALLLARALSGLALGGVPAVAMAHLADEIEPQGLVRAMGLYVAGTALGGMAGRMGVSVLAEWTSWRWALGALAVLALCSAAGFACLLPRPQRQRSARRLDLTQHLAAWACHVRHPGLLALFATAFLTMGSFVTVYNYVAFRLVAPPYLLSESQIGVIFLAYLFGIGSSSTAGALAERWGRQRVMLGGLALCLSGLALSLCMPLAAVVGGVVLLTLGFFLTHAVASGWVGQMATQHKGHAASLYLLAYYLGSSIMGSVGGTFWQWGGWPAVVGFTGSMLGLAWWLGARLPR